MFLSHSIPYPRSSFLSLRNFTLRRLKLSQVALLLYVNPTVREMPMSLVGMEDNALH